MGFLADLGLFLRRDDHGWLLRLRLYFSALTGVSVGKNSTHGHSLLNINVAWRRDGWWLPWRVIRLEYINTYLPM